MNIEINNESDYQIDETAIANVARFTLAVMHVHWEADMGIVLVDELAMTQLHLQWMNEPGPTDVLSFPMDELRPGTPELPSESGLLGDVVLCPQVAEKQAQTAGHAVLQELLLLTVHGTLHLLGFDHAEIEEEREMFALQSEILLNFAQQSGK